MRHGRRTRVRTFALVVALTAAFVARGFAVAAAHATLVSSEPTAGSRLASMPARLRLVFSEPVEAGLATLTLVDGDGRTIALSPAADPHDVHAVVADVPGNGATIAGRFRVMWRIVSTDGHPVGGSFVFFVGTADTAAAAAPPEMPTSTESSLWGPSLARAPVIPALLRGAGEGCLLALAGLLFFLVTASGNIERARRVAFWFSVAAPLLLGAHLLAWLLNTSPEHRIDAAWLSSSFESTVGRVEVSRTILSFLPLWALGLARRPALALGLSLPSILISSAVGHSAAIHPALAVPAKAIHLFALAFWLGGLLWIVVRDRTNLDHASADAARVSTVALWAVVLVTLSGIAQTLLLVPSIEAFRSAYGLVVIAKAAGLGMLVAFGAHHRMRLMPRILKTECETDTAVLRASVSRELLVFSVVMLLGGFLAYLSPPRIGEAAAQSSALETSP